MLTRRLLPFACTAAFFLQPRPCIAQEAERESASWYGWQTLSADGAAVGIAVAGVPAAGLLLYAAGGPVVHGVNGEGTNVALSLSTRVGAPLLGAAIGRGLADCPPRESRQFQFMTCEDSAAIEGVAYGMLAAMLIDGLAIAWKRPASRSAPDPTPETTPRTPAPPPPRLEYGPWLGWRSAGISGRF